MSEISDIKQFEAALEGLLPPGVAHAVRPIPEKVFFRFEPEEKCMRDAADYRKREFFAGRECARAALEQVGFPPAPLPADDRGVPVWPEGARAAISHSRGYCAAIAVRSSEFEMLGLDLERTDRLSDSAMKRVVHPNETGYVQADQRRASLLFSAKEAFFKAQFPIWQTYANFQDLELGVDPDGDGICIKNINPRFTPDLCALAAKIQMRYRFFGDFVVTVCWLKKRD